MVGRLHEKVALVAAAKRQLPQGIVPARSPHSAGCVSRGIRFAEADRRPKMSPSRSARLRLPGPGIYRPCRPERLVRAFPAMGETIESRKWHAGR
jgi:hypothetical protein